MWWKRSSLRRRARDINPAALRRCTEEGFEHPSYRDVRALKAVTGETGSEVARRVGVTARTWRKWAAPDSSPQNRPIPYAAWRLLLIEYGVVRY